MSDSLVGYISPSQERNVDGVEGAKKGNYYGREPLIKSEVETGRIRMIRQQLWMRYKRVSYKGVS